MRPLAAAPGPPVGPPTLSPRDAYARWAATYQTETPLTVLEGETVAALDVPLAPGIRLLDAGCGTGRRLRTLPHGSLGVGIDLSEAMIAQGRSSEDRLPLAAADIRALPFPDRTFDVVHCRLVLGHLPALDRALEEMARVLDQGGVLVVTDFHPAATAAGWRRTFRDTAGRLWQVQHFDHGAAALEEAARAVGLALRHRVDTRTGPSIRPFYERAGTLAEYDRHIGTPVVIGLSFERR